MSATIVLSPAKSPLVVLMGDTFSRRFFWEEGDSRPVHWHIGESESYGDSWSMQEPGVPFRAYHLHGPMGCHGEHYAIVCYKSASWACLTPGIQQGHLEMGSHWGDDM